MPTISSQLDDLRTLIGRAVSIEELDRLLECAKAELSVGEDELRVELNDTNRPDLWSTEGVARQIRFVEGRPVDYPFFEEEPGTKELRIDAGLTFRPYAFAFIARGLDVDDDVLKQLIQTQEKLAENFGHKRKSLSIGIYKLDRIDFPVHYRAVDPEKRRFVPLGMEAPLDLRTILTEHPKGIEYADILRGRERFPLLEDAEGTILSFPPIINSRAVGEVQIGDSDLFVEVTGTVFESCLLAMNIFATNLADRGAAIERVVSVYESETPLGERVATPHRFGRSRTVSLSQFQKFLGETEEPESIAATLERYGCGVRNLDDEELQVTLPPWRLDYLHPVDVIEDYAMARGYGSFQPIMPQSFTVGKLAPITRLGDKARDVLLGFGFEEVFCNILMSPEELRDRMALPESLSLVEIANVMSETYSALRDSLLPSLLRVEAASKGSLYPHRIFEVGEVAIYDPSQTQGSRTEMWAGCLIADQEAGFSEIHGYLDAFAAYLGCQTYHPGAEANPDLRDEPPFVRLEGIEDPRFIPGRAGRVHVRHPATGAEEAVGVIGECHPRVLDAWGITMPAAAFELTLNPLLT